MLQCGFFDLDNRYQKLDEHDPLISLNRLVDWEHFRPTLTVVQEKNRKSRAGRTPYDVVLMFKVLVIQHLYNLSDNEAEYQIRDRYSFCRFLGPTPEGKIPDAKTMRTTHRLRYGRIVLIKARIMKSAWLRWRCVAMFTKRAIGIIRYRSAARSRMLGVQKSVLESSPFLGH